MRDFPRIPVMATLALCAGLIGCSGSALEQQVITGDVVCGGTPAALGEVRFVPIEETTGPVNFGRVVDGRYTIDARKGVPAGTYRVEVELKQKTGRKVTQEFNGEQTEVDEEKPIGAPQYAGESSPLRATVPVEGGVFAIEIPAA